jgi:thiamine pyrophosphate-dependent acetolactate synthase large subunit-like protein
MDVMEEMNSIGIAEPSVIDRSAIAGSLPTLAAKLAAVRPGRLAIIAGDEIYWSQAAQEVTALAETFGAPVYGSSWRSRLPFPTSAAFKKEVLSYLDTRGAKYPAEHNVGHLYHASEGYEAQMRRLDPTNSFNPGVGKTSKKKYWQ